MQTRVESGQIRLACTLGAHLQRFLDPLLVELDEHLDKRLVRTFAGTIAAILRFRHPRCGLLLSELGAYLTSPLHAPAGTKRLSNLLRSRRWSAEQIADFLWSGAEARLHELEEAAEDALVLWDESVLEKPESTEAHGLCPVRSSKAARLKHVKPGFYTPPGGPPVFVPGLHWLALLLIGRTGPPTLAKMQWWTTRGVFTSERRWEEDALLHRAAEAWGARVLHVFDRGFAGSAWLGELSRSRVRFVLRWPKHYRLFDAKGQEKKAWEIARGKRSQDERLLPQRRRLRRTGLLVLPVAHAAYPTPLWLVISRPGQGREPWYLLTNEPLDRGADAWRVVFAYARRWQIEMAFRFTKSELALESPRLWFWDNRLKLLLMVSLAYAFLLQLLQPARRFLCDALLRIACPRTGKRSRETPTPLYRLRIALCALGASLPTPSLPQVQNSG
jgi:hypothetical protein